MTIEAAARLNSASAQLLGRPLPSGTSERLLQWRDRLLLENQRVNLTGIDDPEEAVSRLVLDSLAGSLHLESAAARPGPVLDMGTGGGIPGVPLAILHPDRHFLLVDGRSRKIDALRRITADLQIENITPIWGRLEDLASAGRLRRAATVLARAVGPLATVIDRAAPVLAPGGTLVIWKQAELPLEEIQQARSAAGRHNLRTTPEISYTSYRPSVLLRWTLPERSP